MVTRRERRVELSCARTRPGRDLSPSSLSTTSTTVAVTRSITALFGATVLAILVLAGCDLWGGSEIDDDIASFVAEEHLPETQQPTIVFRDSIRKVKAFQVKFGPPCDCPSGCVYSTAYGLKFRGRIGWMDLEALYCSRDSLDADRDTLDVRAEDRPLFRPEFRDRFRTATADRDPSGYAQGY